MKLRIAALLLTANQVFGISINNAKNNGQLEDQSLLELEKNPNTKFNYTLNYVPPVNLTGKKYKDFDLQEFAIQWNGSREDIFENTIDRSRRYWMNASQ